MTILLPVACFLHCNWSMLTEAGKSASLLRRSKGSDQEALDDWIDLKPSSALMTSCNTCSATTRSPPSDYGLATACPPVLPQVVTHTHTQSRLPVWVDTAHTRPTLPMWVCLTLPMWVCLTLPMWVTTLSLTNMGQTLYLCESHTAHVRHITCVKHTARVSHALPMWHAHTACVKHALPMWHTHTACVKHTLPMWDGLTQTPQHVLQSCW